MEDEKQTSDSEAEALQKRWQKCITQRETDYDIYWRRGDAVVRRYEDDREEVSREYVGKREEYRRYNVFWSNTETLQPALFSRVPEPVIQRRNKEADVDQVGITAADVWQRATTANVERKDVSFVDHMNLCVHNYLVAGTGQMWARYEPRIGPDMGISDELAMLDYVHWRDFLCSKANAWSQVWWVARKLWFTEKRATEVFGPEKAVLLKYQKRDGYEDKTQPTDDVAAVYEIWDKRNRQVVFMSKGCSEVLKYAPAPLDLNNFFPCPEPLYSTRSTRDVIPIPFFYMYQDQAKELDEITTQIYVLTDACKVVGVYNMEMGADFQKVFEGKRNKLIPVQNWNNFLQKGGSAGNIVFIPLGDVVGMLQALYNAREAVKADLAEITGITDIMRGVSSPMDAEGTNQLKVQWGSMRIRQHQRNVQRFARDCIALTAEIIAEQFAPQTIIGLSGVRLPTMQDKQGMEMTIQLAQQGIVPQPDPEQVEEVMTTPPAEQVLGLLRTDKLRGFALEIETDSTIEPDDFKEKTQRTEFVQAVAELLQTYGPMVMQTPELLPFVKETILFALQPYRAGRTLMDELERSLDAIMQKAMAMQSAPPQPTDIDKALNQDMQKTVLQEQGDTQRQAMQDRTEIQKKAMDIAADREANQLKVVADVVKGIQ